MLSTLVSDIDPVKVTGEDRARLESVVDKVGEHLDAASGGREEGRGDASSHISDLSAIPGCFVTSIGALAHALLGGGRSPHRRSSEL